MWWFFKCCRIKEPNTGSDSLKKKRIFSFAESKKKLLLVPVISKTLKNRRFSWKHQQRTKSSNIPTKKKRAPTSIKALHKFVQNFVCLLLTYLAYICGWSQAAARYRTTHQSCARYSSTTTNQHVLLMSSTEGTPPHCAPTPTSLYNWSMSLWVLIIFFPKSSLMDFLQLYFLFSILNCTSGHSVIDGGWVISLSLSLSLSHTHTQTHS